MGIVPSVKATEYTGSFTALCPASRWVLKLVAGDLGRGPHTRKVGRTANVEQGYRLAVGVQFKEKVRN